MRMKLSYSVHCMPNFLESQFTSKFFENLYIFVGNLQVMCHFFRDCCVVYTHKLCLLNVQNFCLSL